MHALMGLKSVIVIVPLVGAVAAAQYNFDPGFFGIDNTSLWFDGDGDVRDVFSFVQMKAGLRSSVEVANLPREVPAGVPHLSLFAESIAFLSTHLAKSIAFLTEHVVSLSRLFLFSFAFLLLFYFVGQAIIKEPSSNHEHRDEEHREDGLVQSSWQDPFCLRDFRREELCKAMPRVGLAVLWWLLGLYSNNVAQAWLQSNMQGYYEAHWTPKLPEAPSVTLWDLGHSVFPDIPVKPWVADAWAQSMCQLAFVRFIVLPGPRSMRWAVVSRMLLIWGFLWAFRGIMIISTVMPNPEKTCQPAISFPNNIFLEALANMPFVFWKTELTCMDVIFSGHAAAMTLATMVYLHYDERAPWPKIQSLPQWLSCSTVTFFFKVGLVANMFVGFFIIIVSKTHYTADVLTGFTVTLLAFQAYHAAIGIAFLPETKPALLSSGICPILPLLRWLDRDAADVAALRRSLSQEGTRPDYSNFGPKP